MDLFKAAVTTNEGPLAARMRPRNLDEYIGQDHIVGKGRLLRRAIAADQLTSVIFYGPPGTGKTTLARVIANHTKSNFITLNAVLTGVQNIRDAIAQAENYRNLYGKKTILFVDEVHRWNKSQQDALLPWVENGTFILVGATTENPFFEVNKALVSRSRVFQLKPLTADDLKKAAMAALADTERGYGRWNVKFEDGALEHLIETANGDARSLLNALELAVETTPEVWKPNENPCIPPENTEIFISKETAEESIQQKVVLYDRDGDYHYDIISAFIKSLRGRDPDAAMYWMARMIAAGEDPHFIFRRMLISACEDTGLADPYALGVVESCAAAFDRVGLPEGRYHLAHAALYLATAPKSNSSMAFFDALSAVEKEDSEVPNHLRDASRDAEGFGHGEGYMYPHAYRDHWVAQQYLPDGLTGRVFYTPTNQGYEKTIYEDVLSRREMQIAAMQENDSDFFNEQTGENLTFSPGDKKRDTFQKRLDSNRAEILLDIRNIAISMADYSRHLCTLIFNADDGLFLWEVWRKTPEGYTCGICKTEKGKIALEQYARTLSDLDRPCVETSLENLKDKGETKFDRFFYNNPVADSDSIEKFITELLDNSKEHLLENGKIIITQKIPSGTQRLSNLLLPLYPNKKPLLEKMLEAENIFYSGKTDNKDTDKYFNWNEKDLEKTFTKNGFTVNMMEKTFTETRHLTETDIEKWFNKDKSSYAEFITTKLGIETSTEIKNLLLQAASTKSFEWKSKIVFFNLLY